ncbi:MAG: YfiR family protein [Verrucomicrobiae bacterium]|nr:YfiR family protein [Verrucomicrobiae bacterium]
MNLHSPPGVTRPSWAASFRPEVAWGRFPGLLAVLLGVLSVSSPASAPPREHEVRAAFLINFARFVEWPSAVFEGDAPLAIGVVGDEAMASVLELIVPGQTVGRRRLEVRRLALDDDFTGIHLLYLDPGPMEPMGEVLRPLSRHPVLVVGRHADFVGQGGMIGFVLVDRNVRFDINLRATQAARLQISSRLLSLARTVIR